ncbi:MAG: putative sporulation protein YtxC [Bacillota bacterium]
MEVLAIGTSEEVEPIRERLSSEFRFLEEEGLNVSISESDRGSLHFLDCRLGEHRQLNRPEAVESFQHYVANALSDVIINEWERNLIRKMIRADYYYFSQQEQDAIYDYTRRGLTGEIGGKDAEVLYKINRKGRVLEKLLEYLRGNSELVIEGFITFRLRDYMADLEDAVDQAVDDFLLEREYHEFIRLLKYFVDAQEPKLDLVHVFLSPDGTFKLVDSQQNVINNEYLEGFVAEMIESEVNYEDLLVSALITIAPKTLTVHTRKAKDTDETLETIRNVFGDRAKFCYGCRMCEEHGLLKPVQVKGKSWRP